MPIYVKPRVDRPLPQLDDPHAGAPVIVPERPREPQLPPKGAKPSSLEKLLAPASRGQSQLSPDFVLALKAFYQAHSGDTELLGGMGALLHHWLLNASDPLGARLDDQQRLWLFKATLSSDPPSTFPLALDSAGGISLALHILSDLHGSTAPDPVHEKANRALEGAILDRIADLPSFQPSGPAEFLELAFIWSKAQKLESSTDPRARRTALLAKDFVKSSIDIDERWKELQPRLERGGTEEELLALHLEYRDIEAAERAYHGGLTTPAERAWASDSVTFSWAEGPRQGPTSESWFEALNHDAMIQRLASQLERSPSYRERADRFLERGRYDLAETLYRLCDPVTADACAVASRLADDPLGACEAVARLGNARSSHPAETAALFQLSWLLAARGNASLTEFVAVNRAQLDQPWLSTVRKEIEQALAEQCPVQIPADLVLQLGTEGPSGIVARALTERALAPAVEPRPLDAILVSGRSSIPKDLAQAMEALRRANAALDTGPQPPTRQAENAKEHAYRTARRLMEKFRDQMLDRSTISPEDARALAMTANIDDSVRRCYTGAAVIDHLAEAIRWTNGRGLATMRNLTAEDETSAYANKARQIIDVTPSQVTGDMLKQDSLHEYGHHFEYCVPDAQAAATEWRSRQSTKNEPTIVDGSPYVVGDFIAPYVGRIYPGSPYTEVCSMGLQYLRSPEMMLELMEKSQSHFELMLGLLRG